MRRYGCEVLHKAREYFEAPHGKGAPAPSTEPVDEQADPSIIAV
jgi:hypothetical protein